MLQKIKLLSLSLAVFGVVGAAVLPATMALADSQSSLKDGLTAAGGDKASGAADGGLGKLIKKIVDVMLYVLGAIAVIMIIIGGISYTTSGGDQAKVTSAKNTILYAVVGLIVAIMAYAIVGFVLDNVK